MRGVFCGVVFGAALFFAAPGMPVAQESPQGDPVQGQRVADIKKCAECHGSHGQGVKPPWPKLEGQYAEYLVDQLDRFLTGERPHPLMETLAIGLTRKDIRDLAAFYACQDEALRDTDWCRPLSAGQ